MVAVTCFFLDLLILLFYVLATFVCVYACAPKACLVQTEVRRRHQIAWDWSYKRFWAPMWVLRIEHGPPSRATSALSCLANSPAPTLLFFFNHTVLFCCKLLHCVWRAWPWKIIFSWRCCGSFNLNLFSFKACGTKKHFIDSGVLVYAHHQSNDIDLNCLFIQPPTTGLLSRVVLWARCLGAHSRSAVNTGQA